MKNIFLNQFICFLLVFIGFNKSYAQDKSIQKIASVNINDDINHKSFSSLNKEVSSELKLIEAQSASEAYTNGVSTNKIQTLSIKPNKDSNSQNSSKINSTLPLVIDPASMDRKP